jgi:hypothetical protein
MGAGFGRATDSGEEDYVALVARRRELFGRQEIKSLGAIPPSLRRLRSRGVYGSAPRPQGIRFPSFSGSPVPLVVLRLP